MAGWNTPARNAAIAKGPCDQKTRKASQCPRHEELLEGWGAVIWRFWPDSSARHRRLLI
jgi:hypothetical protein